MNYKNILKSGSASLVLATAAMMPGLAMAQQSDVAPQASSGDAQAGIADIVVTAQKRSQRLNDVALTLTAATSDQLKTAGVSDITQLGRIASGFNVGSTTSGYQVYSIRGVNFNATQFSAGPTVSSYIDEAGLPYSPMTAGLLLDIDHVEVLKGPQGTLFGQNATGGSINVIAAKPTSSPHAGFDVTANHFGEVQASGFVSGPLSENLLGRISVATTQFGAWQKGYNLNNEKTGDQNKLAGRILLDWTPSSDFKVSLNVNGNYDKGQPQAYQFYTYTPINPAAAVPAIYTYPKPTNNRQAEHDPGLAPRNDNYNIQAALRVEWNVAENAQITSISNYVKSRFDSFNDVDGTAVHVLYQDIIGRGETFTQELRLSGDIPSANIHYIMGGYYQHDDILDATTNQIYGAYTSVPSGVDLNPSYEQKNRAYAVFANADFEIVPGLTLTGGARYTKTRQSVYGCTSGNAAAAGLFGFIGNLLRGATGQGPADAWTAGECLSINDVAAPGAIPTYLPAPSDLKQTEDNISWRAGINYKPSRDTLLYVLASRGYKAGLFPFLNIVLNSQVHPVKQEELTSYEIGAKVGLFNRTVQLSLSAFHYDYKDKQFYTYIVTPIGPASTIVNIPTSKVDGIDAEVTATLFGRLDLHGGLTYIKTKVGAFSGYDIALNPVDFTGNRFNLAPAWSGTFNATYRMPISDELEGSVGLDGVYNSATNGDIANPALLNIDAYTILDARIGLKSTKGWTAGLWVRNFTNKYYWTSAIGAGDVITRITGRPRTFGATVGFKF